jgi:hypothetical protein
MNVRHFAVCTLSFLGPVAVLVLASYDLIPLAIAVPAAIGATFLAATINMLVRSSRHVEDLGKVERVG